MAIDTTRVREDVREIQSARGKGEIQPVNFQMTNRQDHIRFTFESADWMENEPLFQLLHELGYRVKEVEPEKAAILFEPAEDSPARMNSCIFEE